MLLVSYQGGISDFYNSNGTINTSAFNYGKAEVPLLFGLKIVGLFRIEAGLLYNRIYWYAYNNDNQIKIEASGIGYRAGASVELGSINFGIAYQGITNTSSASSFATFQSPNEMIFNLCIFLGRNTN